MPAKPGCWVFTLNKEGSFNDENAQATVYGRVLPMGEADTLPDDEMARVLKKFASYGLQDV